MEERHISKKNGYLFIIIAGVGLFFSCIFIIRAFSEGMIYDTLVSTSNIPQGRVGEKIIKMQDTFKADKAIKKQEYEKALQLITGSTSEDYYNRGTIQTLLAYQNALQSSISGLQNAQVFVAQAQQNFDIAKKLSRSKTITNAITNNQTTTISLSAVVDIKTCYGIGQGIILGINDIITTIQNIKNTLEQEDIYINKRASSLDTTCYEKLRNIVDTSKAQVGLLQSEMQKNTNRYQSDFSKKLEDPSVCLQTPYNNILPSLVKGKQGLEVYELQHTNTIEALKINDSQSIKELCDQSKNDAQINQQIESSVKELLEKLEDNTIENQQEKRSTNEVRYKDFFDENEKKALQEVQETNQSRIDTMLEIRGKGNYNPERYINEMFNQFYGNSGDFIDLHK